MVGVADTLLKLRAPVLKTENFTPKNSDCGVTRDSCPLVRDP